MGRIVELKTSQGNSFRIISESINSLISQVNISFYPFYIENAKIIRESVGEWAKSMMIILINSIELRYIRSGC